MTSATVRGAALALALGMGIAGNAQADANATHLPAGSETCWRPDASVSGTFEGFKTGSVNVSVDPLTGREVYLPTGETVDQVLPVVASRTPPAVASTGGGAGGPSQAGQEQHGWSLPYGGALPGGAILLAAGWLLVRRRRGQGVRPSARIGIDFVL
jgi:hypothetical protein